MLKLLKNLQKKGVDLLKNFENRFSESNTFNVLKEKYQSLNMGQQKLIKYFLIVFLFVFVFYFPVSKMFSSILSWSEFKQKYSLSLELLKTRNKNSSFLNLSETDLKMKINRVVKKYSDIGFEIVDKSRPFLKAKSVRQVDFRVSLKHLNIKQIVRLGTELHALPQMRLDEISLEENKKYPKHYNITYKLAAFVSKGPFKTPAIRRPINKKTDRSKKDRDNILNLEDRAIQKRNKKIDQSKKDRDNILNLEDKAIQKRNKKRAKRKRKAVGDQ